MWSSAFDTFPKGYNRWCWRRFDRFFSNCYKCLFWNAQFWMKKRTTPFTCTQKVSMNKTSGWCHPEKTFNEFTDAETQKIGHHFPVGFTLFTLTEPDPDFALSFTGEPPVEPCCWTGWYFITSAQSLVAPFSPQSWNCSDWGTTSIPTADS